MGLLKRHKAAVLVVTMVVCIICNIVTTLVRLLS